MAINSVKKTWGSKKTINYVGKDFDSLRQNLIDFTKTYFPTTYADFNESSPGMVFIEMASFLGDILAYYQDAQLKESMILHASERKNVMSIAQAMGYKPKVTTPAVTTMTVYQLVPSIGSGENNRPDSKYFMKIKPGMEIISTTNSTIVFRTVDGVDFSMDIDRDIDVYSRNQLTGEPDFYLITKRVKAISANENQKTYFIPISETEYPYIILDDTNVIEITSIEDSNGNKWNEVPYLAQETVFSEVANVDTFSGLTEYSGSVPYILEVKKVPRRFSVKVNSNNTHTIQFGNGDKNITNETLLPNSKNIGLGLANSIKRLNTGIDPSNFLKTDTFGLSPAGQTLIVKYTTGGGIESNINTGDLVRIGGIQFDEDLLSVTNQALYDLVKGSIAVENLEPAVGGRGAETIEEIRQNALGMFGSQNRAVTREDYTVRALSMPERYGSVAKVYVSTDGEVDSNSAASILANPKNLSEFVNIIDTLREKSKPEIQSELKKYLTQKRTNVAEVNNPFAINMYLLGYDKDKKLTNLNQAVKQNLKTYLGEYRIVTDGVNLLDGFIVNIGVDFEIICYSTYNKREVLAACITELQDYFNIDNWTFNRPINISELELILANVDGVMSVPMLKINNLCGAPYSPNRYNIAEATRAKMVYPSLDPCVFEVKFPNKDIKGRAL